MRSRWWIGLLCILLFYSPVVFGQTVNIGLNYPASGPYEILGKPQFEAAKIAVEEINEKGGIMGRQLNLITKDSKSQPYLSGRNVEGLIDQDNCEMIFGGVSSAVAIAGGNVAKDRGKLFMSTTAYSNAVTGVAGHKYMFRECPDAWMTAKVLANYLKNMYPNKKYFYVTADYTWGWSTEESIRQFSDTVDKREHRRVYTPFPKATDDDYKYALKKAEESGADVLVLVQAGNSLSKALGFATEMGLKRKMVLVAPVLQLNQVDSLGAAVMEGVLGGLPWCWELPFIYNFDNGKKFVNKYADRYGYYPSSTAGSAYTNVYEYKHAVERAGTFETKAVISALENHTYVSLKGEQTWRTFDHQSVQSVYAVQCKPAEEVLKDKFKQDYFEILYEMEGDKAVITEEEWTEIRRNANKPPFLEW